MSAVRSGPAFGPTAAALANRPAPYAWCTVVFVVFFAAALLIGWAVERAFDGLEAGDRAQVLWAAGALAAVEAGRIAVFHPGLWSFARTKAATMTLLRANMVSAQVASGGERAAPPVVSAAAVTPQFRDDPEDVVMFADVWIDLLGSVVFAVVAVGVMGAVEPLAAIVAVPATILVAGASALLDGEVRRTRTAERRAGGRVTELLGDLFVSPASIAVNGATGDVTAAVADLAAERSGHAVRSRVLEDGVMAFANGLGPVALAVVVLLGLDAVVAGDLDAAELGLFATYLSYLRILPRSAGLLLTRRSQAAVAVSNMAGVAGGSGALVTHRPIPVLGRDAEPAPVADRPALREPLERLELRSFGVRADGAVLVAPVDLAVEAGEFVVVAGEIGVGKTLLLRALVGQLDRGDLDVVGDVVWNGHVVADRAAWMVPPRVATVAQHPAFLTDSVEGNLRLGRPIESAALAAAVDRARLGADLGALADGLATGIGPRGVRLSGGQRQRLAVARALATGSEVVVFDDVSSALDVATEAALWDGLRELGATVVATSNRPVAHRAADRVITLPTR